MQVQYCWDWYCCCPAAERPKSSVLRSRFPLAMDAVAASDIRSADEFLKKAAKAFEAQNEGVRDVFYPHIYKLL